MNRVVFNLLLAGERQGWREELFHLTFPLFISLSVFPLSHFSPSHSFPAFPCLPTPTPLPSLLNLASVRPLKASTLSSSFLEATLAASTQCSRSEKQCLLTGASRATLQMSCTYNSRQEEKNVCMNRSPQSISKLSHCLFVECRCTKCLDFSLRYIFISKKQLPMLSSSAAKDPACFFSLFLFCTNT